MEPTKADVLAILDAHARMPRPTGPVTLSPAYLRAVERWEQLPENAPGSDKSWVLRADRSARDTFARARRALAAVEPFPALAAALNDADVRYVTIGVGGANLWARSGHTIFTTRDYDLFLPPEPGNTMRAWHAAEARGLELFCGDESLDRPRDLFLAERIAERRALVRATDGAGFDVDLTMVMAGYDFEPVFARRSTFVVEGVTIPVASLRDIIASKAAAGREKDRLFLASHEEALRSLIDDQG